MTLDAKIYDKLCAIDPDLADEYLYSESRSTILWDMLQEIRDMFDIPMGVSILEALRDVVAVTEAPAEKPVEIKVKEKKVKPPVESDRQSIMNELDELSMPWKKSDSTKRLAALLKKSREIAGKEPSVVSKPTIIKPSVTKTSAKQDTKKSIIKGWG